MYIMNIKNWNYTNDISSIESKDEMEDMTDELIDRFGEMPKAVYNLLYVAYLKSLAHHAI